MNLFTFIAHGRNGRIYNGLFQASDGTDARRVLPNLLTAAGIDVIDFDFHGVTSKTFTCYSHVTEESVFLNTLKNSGMDRQKDCAPFLARDGYSSCLAEIVYTRDNKNEPAPQSHNVTLGSGNGYAGFVASFHFNHDGKLVSHGVFE